VNRQRGLRTKEQRSASSVVGQEMELILPDALGRSPTPVEVIEAVDSG
jgi:hypothetical protein